MTRKRKKFTRVIREDILGGVLIGLAGAAWLMAPNNLVGMFFFSIGLCAILIIEASLFTGAIGFVYNQWLALGVMLVLNCGGAALMSLITLPLVHEQAVAACIAKLSTPSLLLLSKSILCGMCVYLAVVMYQTTSNLLTIILCVMVFVGCGFNHCIADFYFMVAAGMFSIRHFAICVIGNSIGAIGLHRLKFML